MSAPETAPAGGRRPLPARRLAQLRRTRRHPRATQFDYLHLRRLMEDLAPTLRDPGHPVGDALDVFCGTQPYRDMFPAGARVVGWDVDGHYGTADVVGGSFLPFDDASFDLVACIEGFHYVEDLELGVRELARVLRPGGTVVITVPLVWEYDRTILEHRWTGPELAFLFRDWDSVDVVENGRWAISWATLTGRLLGFARSALPRPLAMLAGPLFALGNLVINGVGAGLDSIERRHVRSDVTLPMNLMLTARRPVV